ncbi:MAG: ATP-binding protein [Gammaproteobacteria bacterium]
MALKITKATDTIEVKNLTVCIYAAPGIGKSTLAFTADSPLLIDFDQGAYRAGNRGDVVQVSSWSDVASITAEDLKPYKTLVVDTAGRALDFLTASIIEGNPKLGRGGALTLQGFGELKARFIAWTKLIRSFGLDVVLISHSDEQRSGDEIIERLDIQGGSKNEIYKAADVMGRLYLSQGKRILNFSPTDTAFGKNPAQLPPLEVPHYAENPQFLAGVIAQIKAELNKQSESQKEVASMLADWKAKIDEAKTADDFSALIPQTQELDERVRDNVKRLLAKVAKSKGFQFDKKTGKFSAAEAKAA